MNPAAPGLTSIYKKPFSLKLFKSFEGYLYIMPALLLAITFRYFPFLKTIMHSFSLVNPRGKFIEFIGLENFKLAFESPKLLNALLNTLRYTAIELPLSIIAALILALIANKQRLFSKVYQTMFALPMAISMAVTSLIFKELFDPNLGLINWIIGRKIFWLQDPNFAMYVIIFISIWTSVGFPYMLLLAALRGIPQDLVEEADLEGINYFQKVWHIFIPLISPTLFFVITTRIATCMTMAGPVLILTQGGPQGSTQTLVHYIYSTTFMGRDYSLASVASILTFVLTFSMLLINFLYEKKGVFYE